MKKILFLLALIPSLVFAQIPTSNPSFTVFQRVGTGEVEFTFKAISIEEPIETILQADKAYYPGGRTYFIVRTNKDMSFSEMNLPKGNYIGGFKMLEDQVYLVLEPEDLPNDLNEDEMRAEEGIKVFSFPLERLPEFECRVQGQSFMVMPNQGGLNYSAVTFVLGDQTFFLTIGINDDDFYDKMVKDLSKANKKETKKFLLASKYAIEANIDSQEPENWLRLVVEQDPKNWEGYFWLAKFYAKSNNFEKAVKEMEKAKMVLQKDRFLNAFQQNEVKDEIDYLMKEWSTKI